MTAADEIPIGPHLQKMLAIAYRARRAVLLEGATGIGKSEIVHHVADALGLGLVCLDLSLLEPPDLVGLPTMASGRTVYAPPSILPREGSGLLLLEELNRAERHVQQPALQLLTARRLHDYELPAGWSCIAAVNPEDGDYHVTPLDPALRARFLQVRVCADRKAWLAWAARAGVHAAVQTVVRSHDRVFDEVPPRSWAYASDVLRAIAPEDRDDPSLLHDVLVGYLGAIWTEVLISVLDRYAGELDIQPRQLLASYDEDPGLQHAIRGYRAAGKTDVLSEIVHRLLRVLRSPEAVVLARAGELRLAAFEAFVADLEGDQRELLQEAIGSNPTVALELGVAAEDILAASPGSPLARDLASWSRDPLLRHRALMFATLLAAHARRRRSKLALSEASASVLAPVLALSDPAVDRLREQLR